MKVESFAGNNVKARFGNEGTKKFGIAKEAEVLVMKYLTDLYDDPVLAAVRETISNGIDAHLAAKTSNKVKITVSSPMDSTPYFEVSDTGVGMSSDVLNNVYTQYGVSTKSDDDEAIGGFGLGCKSPLAIEDRFYIETTQDGVTLVAEIYKNNIGEFVLDINDEYESNKPNGTTVRINLEKTSIYTLRDKLTAFLKFVNPELYTLHTTNASDTFNVEYALNDKEKYLLITNTDEFKVYANLKPDYYEAQKIVMGEVAYNFNIPQSVFDKVNLDRESLKVIIIAPINSVTITTSRENTQDTKKTKNFLEKVYLQFEADINDYFQKYVDESETPVDVYKRVREAQKFSRRTYKFKGNDIVDQIRFEKSTDYSAKRYGSAPSRGRTGGANLAGRDRIFLVRDDGTPETKEGAITRAFNAFLSSYELDSGTFYFLDKEEPAIDSWWVTENPFVFFIDKGDILKVASEYRKQQRRINGTNRRQAGKVSYAVINNDPETAIDDDYMQNIEYPEIEKGIDYLTMQDLVAYGVTRSANNAPREVMYGIKRLLDFFDYTGEVLILDKGKKEETMVKRTKAEKLEFDFLGLDKQYEAAKNRAYINHVHNEQSFIDKLKKTVGEDNFNNLLDPRFVEYAQEETVEGETMTSDKLQEIKGFINNLAIYGNNSYTERKYSKICDMKNKWRQLGSYYWIAQQTQTSRAKIEALKDIYEGYIAMNISRTNPRLVVQVFNTVYEDYLTPRQKML